MRDPKVNRLRQLWVGVQDYLPRRVVVAGNFTIAPLVDVPWTIDFSVVSGAPFIADEIADQTLFMPHDRVVRKASIEVENVKDGAGSRLQDRPLLQPPSAESTLEEPPV